MYNIEFDIVVLVDCWPSDHPEMQKVTQEKFYKRLLNKLSTMKFKNVVFATYKGGTEPNETFETDPYLVEHLSSASHGADVISKECFTIKDVYKEFPELYNKSKDINVLVGGQSWWHCLHWRPLGFCGWIQQNQVVYSHPEIVHFEGNHNVTHFKAFHHDPIITWKRTEDCLDETYRSIEISYDISQVNPPDIVQFFKYMYVDGEGPQQ